MPAKQARSKPEWTEARVRRELEQFLEGATEWPSYRDFQRAGRQHLRDRVNEFGGARLWAKRLGVPYPERKPGYAPRWTEERVRADLEEFLRGRDYWPSRLEFEAAGRAPLRDAVRRMGGPERWATEFGLPLRNLKSGSTRVWTDERIEAELRRVLDGRDTWPGRRELERKGRFGLVGAVYHAPGAAYWARRLGAQAGTSSPATGASHLDRRADPRGAAAVLWRPDNLADRARVRRGRRVQALQRRVPLRRRASLGGGTGAR